MASLKPATNYTSCSLHEPVKILASEESLSDISIQTIPEFFHQCCERFRDYPALAYKDKLEQWATVSYEEYERNVERAALALLYLGVEPRTSVGILSFNCPEWFYVNLAAVRINAVSAGIYTTNSAEAVFHILETSDASVVVVDDTKQLQKIRSIRASLPQLKAVVQLHGPYDFDKEQQEEGYYRWSDLWEMEFSTSLREELLEREREVAANDCALLIFTSGTVGMPKGCMISHDGILYCAKTINRCLPYLQQGGEKIISYLPLNHMAAQLFDMFMGMEFGAVTYFADRNALKGTLGRTLQEVQPTVMFGVPRIFEKMQEQLMLLEANSGCLKRCLLQRARNYMQQYHLNRLEGKPNSCMKYWLASKLTNRIKHAIGLGSIKDCIIGGAPVTEELKLFFLSLDLPLTDVFGMSETSGGIIFNFEKTNLLATGKPVEGVEIKIKDPTGEKNEGELLVRGRTNFMGYLKEPEKTKDTVTDDCWILTGDVAYLDTEGNVYVSGRIKELIITAGGENIPPVHIESLIKKELPCLSNVMAIGDHRKYLTALLTFKTDIDPHTGYPMDTLLPETKEWLASLDLHYNHLSEMLHIELPENLQDFDPNSVEVQLDNKVQLALEAGIERYNLQAISNAQKIQYFSVLPHDFSIPTGELGPTLKIRRNIVHTKYAKVIDKMYQKN
ncbi:long-chain-fatty-acid--CoA ligase heimdall [Musca vetustissima]|uniref:long-chain-fatty-acid--CoA ligase heimdall n=1 Tax=Musca vetustissima TaxID=27455 RepID=UPI002AB7A365|nr:long-chain-fatty-acid--CoA ligase heimdall [Musca vetustissima]